MSRLCFTLITLLANLTMVSPANADNTTVTNPTTCSADTLANTIDTPRQPYAVLNHLDRQLLQGLSQIFDVFCHQADAIWAQTYRLDNIPLLLVYRDQQQQDQYGFLINHPKAASLPSAQAVNPLGLSLPPVSKLHQLPEAHLLSNSDYVLFQLDIAGTPTFVVFYHDPNDNAFTSPGDQAWNAFLVHEGLHHQQEGTWQGRDDELQNVREYPLDRQSIADILLETHTLLSALSATTNEERRQAIQDFVSVRTARMASHPIIRGMDATQERYEGTSHYIEHRLKAIIPNNTIPDIATLLRGNLSQQGNRLSLALGRFYISGASLSAILDDLSIDWKPLIESGLTHYDILKHWLADDTTEVKQTIAAAKIKYNYTQLLEQADSMAKRIEQ